MLESKTILSSEANRTIFSLFRCFNKFYFDTTFVYLLYQVIRI